jgi:S1-C subfamily serine protease
MSEARRLQGTNWFGAMTVVGVAGVFLALTAAWARQGQPDRSTTVYLGIMVNAPQAGERGIQVREVTPDSPAAKAGLRASDQIIKVDDRDVTSVEQFLQTVASHKPNDKMTLHVMRGGQEQMITATLGERPAGGEIARTGRPGLLTGLQPAFLGVQTQPLTAELKQRLQVQADTGAVVTEVVPNSPAAKAGLKADDVITAINDKAVRDPAQLREVIQEAGPDHDVTIKVARGNQNLTVQAKLGLAGLGMFLTPGGERFPTLDVESMMEHSRRLREMERRIEDLEKRVRELEKK